MSRPARALGALALIAWPGLPQVWRRGSLRALAVACLFGAFLNALVLGSFVWDEVASPRVLHVAWSVAIGFWVAAALFSAQKWPSVLEAPPPVSRQDLFPEALGQYLQGNWFGAEALCRRVLRLQDRDAEARLMLATVLRRTGRKADALQELAVLCSQSGSGKWQREVADERRRLELMSHETSHEAAADEPQSTDAQSVPSVTALRLIAPPDTEAKAA